MNTEIKLPELDNLIEKAEQSEDYLRNVIQVYAESVADHWDVADTYKEKIADVCDQWSEGEDLAEGMKHLVSAICCYYTTRFKEVAVYGDKAINQSV